MLQDYGVLSWVYAMLKISRIAASGIRGDFKHVFLRYPPVRFEEFL